MARLDTMLLPGEEVRARAGLANRDSWAVGASVFAVFLLLDAIRPLASWLSAPSMLPDALAWPAALLALGLAVLLVVRFTGFLSMISGGDRLLVTDRRVLWWLSPLGLARRSLDRSLVTAATAYKGGSLVILHLSDGRNLRLRHVDEVEAAARALAVPARILRPGNASDISTRLEGYNKLAFLGVLAVALATYGLIDHAAASWPLSEGIGRPFSILIAIAAAVFAAMVAWILLFDVARHFVAARRLDHRALRHFACSRLDRGYQGREPWPKAGGPPWIWWPRAYRRWILRHAYKGKLDCACEPEEIGPQESRRNTF